MIKYELKKNLIYNKFYILIILLIIQVITINIFVNKNINSSQTEVKEHYYNYLQGEITETKINFINNEEKNISEFDEKTELYRQQFKNGEITDKKYIENIEAIQSLHYRAQVFEEVKEYVDYLKQDKHRLYIDEEHMNNYLDMDMPYSLIVIIVLITVISFQNEESMYQLIKVTKVGKNRLIKTKILTLISINSMIFLSYFMLDFLLKYKMIYFSELLAPLSSTRFFEGTDFQGNILAVIIIFFIMQWLAVIILTYITSLLCIKTKIGGLKLCILEIGTYIVSLLMFTYSKWIYFISPIGFFNPKRYFFGERILGTEGILFAFSIKQLATIIIVTLVLLLVISIKRKKLYKLPVLITLCILFSGCQNQKDEIYSTNYSNINGFSINEEVSVYTVENQMMDIKQKKCYVINRDILKSIETVNYGYMYHQYYYFIATNETEISIQRLDTENFEQKEIYRSDIFKYDIFGNMMSTSRYNIPIRIYIEDNQVYLMYYNRVEVLLSYNKTKLLFEGEANIIKIEGEKLYYISDKSQLVSFDLNTFKREECLNTLISNAYIDDQYIYYIKLRDERLYRFKRLNGYEEQIVNEHINFFQIMGDEIYYTTVGKKGLNVNIYKDKFDYKLLNEMEIYAFSVFDNKIIFTAYDNNLHKISWYYYSDKQINRIN